MSWESLGGGGHGGACHRSTGAAIDGPALLDELGRRQWTYLLIEGGPTVLDAVVRAGLADEVMVYVSPRRVAVEGFLAAEDASALPRYDIATVAQVSWLPPARRESFGVDTLLHYRITR